MKRILLISMIASLGFSSCSSDDTQLTEENMVFIPENYTFERDNSSTVNYGGQTTRLQMSAELLSAFNDFDNQTAESLSDMFSNENSAFSSADLNESPKSIKSKVAASNLYFSSNTIEGTDIKNDFEAFIDEHMNVVKPNRDVLAEPGVAGQIADGQSARYVNSKGLELDQAFAKGLIGGLLADQMLNNYLSTAVLDEGDNRINNDAEVTEEGKNYTTMEHKWDEAYGYLYGHPSIPGSDPNSALNQSDDRLLFKYLGSVDADENFAGIAQSTFEAFKTGRAAIVAGDYDLRDEQAAIIRENVSRLIAVRAIYYMQAGKNELAEEKHGTAFHSLSEGFGFIYSLRFTHDPATGAPYLSKEEIDGFKQQLLEANGFWDVTSETLDSISQEIAAAFGFNVAGAF